MNVPLSFLEESTTYNSSSVHNTLHSLKRDAYKSTSNSNMEWNNNLRNSSERQETTTSSAVAPSAPFYKKTAPDPPPKLATSLTNGQRHSKVKGHDTYHACLYQLHIY